MSTTLQGTSKPFHEAARAWLGALGISHRDLADKCEVSAATVSRWLNGTGHVTLARAKQIADVCGVSSLDRFLAGPIQ